MGFHVADKNPVELNVGRVPEISLRRLLEPRSPRRRSGPVTEISHEIVTDGVAVAEILELLLQTRATVHRAWRISFFARRLHLAERFGRHDALARERLVLLLEPRLVVGDELGPVSGFTVR